MDSAREYYYDNVRLQWRDIINYANIPNIDMFSHDMRDTNIISGMRDYLTKALKCYPTEFQKCKTVIFIGPLSRRDKKGHLIKSGIYIFTNLQLPSDLDSTTESQLIQKLIISVRYNASLETFNPSKIAIDNAQTRRVKFSSLFSKYATRLQNRHLDIKVENDRYSPKSYSEIPIEDAVALKYHFNNSMVLMKYDGVRIIAVCTASTSHDIINIECYTRHAMRLYIEDPRIHKLADALSINIELPFVIEMEGYIKGTDSTGCAKFISHGKKDIKLLSLAVFNIIPFKDLDMIYQNRYELLAVISEVVKNLHSSDLNKIHRAELMQCETYKDAIANMIEIANDNREIDGMVMWHKNEKCTEIGGIFKVKNKSELMMTVTQINTKNDMTGITAECVVGDITATATVHATATQGELLSQMARDNPHDIPKVLSGKVKVVHYGIQNRKLRHPYIQLNSA